LGPAEHEGAGLTPHWALESVVHASLDHIPPIITKERWRKQAAAVSNQSDHYEYDNALAVPQLR
jgi:hypothetical protein